MARLSIVEEYGGLYVDLDLILVRPLDPLLDFDVVLGAETPELLGSGLIFARAPGSSPWPRDLHPGPGIFAVAPGSSPGSRDLRRGPGIFARVPGSSPGSRDLRRGPGIFARAPAADFVRLWRRAYADDFDDGRWNEHACRVPMTLARRHPDLIHVEWFSMPHLARRASTGRGRGHVTRSQSHPRSVSGTAEARDFKFRWPCKVVARGDKKRPTQLDLVIVAGATPLKVWAT